MRSNADAILKLINSGPTITKAVAENPTEEITKVARTLFAEKLPQDEDSWKRKKVDNEYSREDLDIAHKCGKFPYTPSGLFLKMYSDVLDTLHRDPLINMVSPSLIASSGVIPLTIVSVIPDIMKHYKHLISNAKVEVMIATNFWERSYSSSFIREALIELSKRHQDNPMKPVVKLIYDRGNIKQVIKNHIKISPDHWEALGLPQKEEIPNIEFEVLNFHRPVMGTFHAKYLIVDRKVACLNSNNIQDRANMEMMTHIEGPIVDAFYDMCLLTWSEAMHPPLWLLRGRADLPTESGGEGQYLGDAGSQHREPTVPSVGPETAEGFRPHILHRPRKPFPIAMVNRGPHGTPGHSDVDVPQNAAWLAGFKLAQKNIFIQTPTFNAAPAVKAILDACRRGVECTLYLDLGFNDSAEQLPMQGGTNSKVVADMYETLNAENKQQFLRVFWYVGKDQSRPIDAAERKRNCHIKFCSIDGQVAIQGSGNQDSQSWFHSQEINIMVDSAEMCLEWRAGIDNNQNTAIFGRVDDRDALWRDKEGNVVDSSGGKGGTLSVIQGAFAQGKRFF